MIEICVAIFVVFIAMCIVVIGADTALTTKTESKYNTQVMPINPKNINPFTRDTEGFDKKEDEDDDVMEIVIGALVGVCIVACVTRDTKGCGPL